MVIDGHTLPCYFSDGFCKPTNKTAFTLVWFRDDFRLIFTLQNLVDRMTKTVTDIGLKQTLSSTLNRQINLIHLMNLKALPFHTFMHHIHKTHITLVFHVLNFFHILKHFVANLKSFILHNTQIFLLHAKKVPI